MDTKINYSELEEEMEGDFHQDSLHQKIYATDASVFRKLPLGVAFPKNENDIQTIIHFANKHSIPLIPRAAGTSLAGQCVGEGIIVDVSRYMNQILEFNKEEKWVRIQPGIIRDELNDFLHPHGLFFGPNTSTSNRCMIGGMVGNNSSGSASIAYGVTRDKVFELKTVLSDGSIAVFNSKTKKQLDQLREENTLEGSIYRFLLNQLDNELLQKEIKKQFPKPSIHRRNTGYAIDSILHMHPFLKNGEELNLSKLICGSEGTLGFVTEIVILLDPLPPKASRMVIAHFSSVQEALECTLIAMEEKLYACELMDKTILDCIKSNPMYSEHRFFIQGDPEAVLMLEVRADFESKAKDLIDQLISKMKTSDFGYAFPILRGNEIRKALSLRNAGLGLLGNLKGDKKAVACIEDTAVSLADLPDYISDFTKIMERHEQKAVYYAHAGAGELHLRPILDLKKSEEVHQFRAISEETAQLIKSYGGSLSGEHGDGLARSEFIPLFYGEVIYRFFQEIKKTFDPKRILNPGKIVDALPMDENLRYEADREEPEIDTVLDFSDDFGILRSAEKCNGSGDCRTLHSSGGTMCPSYRVTKNEKDTTRARANVLREVLTNNKKQNRFNDNDLKEAMELCISCKGCVSECPSGVDMARMKSEFLYQYQKENGFAVRDQLFAFSSRFYRISIHFSSFFNFFLKSRAISLWIKKSFGIAPKRSLPLLNQTSFRTWLKKNKQPIAGKKRGRLYLFCDEFTNFLDIKVGQDAVELFTRLGYEVLTIKHPESGRSAISKGMLKEAKSYAEKNVCLFASIILKDTPLVGIEPSAILSFRDEFIRLVSEEKRTTAKELAKNVLTIEEFLDREMQNGNIKKEDFSEEKRTIKIHGHCHQKALSNIQHTFNILNFPKNHDVRIIPSGCCGMAGSFGYEKEHYDISMKIGELTLFPHIRKSNPSDQIAASGFSCRHQIFDGTNQKALHPVSVLKNALTDD